MVQATGKVDKLVVPTSLLLVKRDVQEISMGRFFEFRRNLHQNKQQYFVKNKVLSGLKIDEVL